jgi:methyl-accepting chemotaxis protein
MEQINNSIMESDQIVGESALAVMDQASSTREIVDHIAHVNTSVVKVNQSVASFSNMYRDITKRIAEINEVTNEVLNGTVKMKILSKEATSLSSHLMDCSAEFKAGNAGFDIAKVKNAHLNWRVNLEAALKGYKTIRAEDAADHHGCDFGKWYFSTGQVLAPYSAFSEVGVHHEQVHVLIKKILTHITAGESGAADRMIQQFEKVREDLFNALDELFRQTCGKTRG